MTFHEQMLTSDGVKALAKEWFDTELSDEVAEKLCKRYRKNAIERVKKDTANGYLITAAGPCVWLKTRLNDQGLLPTAGPPPDDDEPSITTAVLHVHFLSLLETAEMLARLQNEPTNRTAKPARSKVFETVARQDIAPIDGTAARVATDKEPK